MGWGGTDGTRSLTARVRPGLSLCSRLPLDMHPFAIGPRPDLHTPALALDPLRECWMQFVHRQTHW